MCRNAFAALTSSLVLSLIVVAGAVPVAAQTVVDTCGQHTSGPATLNADLDCTGFDGTVLTMNGGTLAMNGHTITGGYISVQCDRTCKIIGPGTLTGSGFAGVQAFGTGLKMKQVSSTNHAYAGAQVWDSAMIEGPAVFSGNGVALRVGYKAKLKDLTISNNAAGVDAANNAKTGNVEVKGCTISGNSSSGIFSQGTVKATNSTIIDNGENGIYAAGDSECVKKSGATLKGSTVTGNGTGPDCGVVQECADVATCKQPRVKTGSTCGTSLDLGGAPGATWGICTLD